MLRKIELTKIALLQCILVVLVLLCALRGIYLYQLYSGLLQRPTYIQHHTVTAYTAHPAHFVSYVGSALALLNHMPSSP